ncbi:MAG TPA: aminopeptidase P N-terminal domain-containing protein, partial [Candidatus Acidoferrum sp.]
MRCRQWIVIAVLTFSLHAQPVKAQERREREPNRVYAERRARLASQVDSPIILWGFTGREEISQDYVFAQEENFYYLTGHNEEGAGLVVLPAAENDHGTSSSSWNGPREILFLPPKNPGKEKWNGVRMSPSDPGIEARTGFASVMPFPEMRATVENLAKLYSAFYTNLPYDKELGGYPHEKAVVDWLQLAA